ncbi:MAG TPA: ABC transporter permease, partial [Flavitalea sp.]|nr:ABC transporter permease [Flavitalea sp.]
MIRNFFKIAFRNMAKSKTYSFINVLGLAVGLAVSILIGLWIYDELSFNKYHKNYKQIAQLYTTQTFNNETGTHQAVAIPMAAELRTKYASDFKYVALCSWNFSHLLAVGEKKINMEGMWAEPDFPKILDINILKGSQSALTDPSSVLINKSLAKSLFGTEDPVNKTIKLDNKSDVKVAGVYEDFPHNSNFSSVHFLLSWSKYKATEDWIKRSETQWNNHSFQIFMLLNKNISFSKTTAKIKFIPKAHVVEGKEEVLLHPMEKWHLHSDFKNGKIVGGRIEFVWLFGIIGIFVLLLACINFMNLSTARSEKRAKEVGIRKTVGSLRRQLISQFLSESVLVSLFAYVVAILLVLLLLSFFNGLANKEIRFPWTRPGFWGMTLLFTILTGLIAGSYPAFYLSGFRPVKVLKGTFRVGRYAAVPRKVLVVLQFTVSIALIIGTIIVFRQIQHAKSRPVGYSREGLLTTMIGTEELGKNIPNIEQELLTSRAITSLAVSSSPSTGIWSNQIGFEWKGKDPNAVPLFGIVAVSHDFGKTIKWDIVKGRDFSRSFLTDSGALILNEAAVKLTGLKNPVGEIIKWNDKDRPVVGVVKDMVMESPYSPVKPTIFFLDYGWKNVITMRINPSLSVKAALQKIEPVFKKYNPEAPFDYKFTDDDYAEKFSDEERIGNLATFFAILAIFISCLGLFGLASFVAEQRTKEIGVRKVLGATVTNVWQMLSKDFVVLVLISCVIAIP